MFSQSLVADVMTITNDLMGLLSFIYENYDMFSIFHEMQYKNNNFAYFMQNLLVADKSCKRSTVHCIVRVARVAVEIATP